VGLAERREFCEKGRLRGIMGQSVCDNILRGGDVGKTETDRVAHHEGSVDAPEGTTNKGDPGALSSLSLTGGVVRTEEDDRIWVIASIRGT
jgi:hypothetical protein